MYEKIGAIIDLALIFELILADFITITTRMREIQMFQSQAAVMRHSLIINEIHFRRNFCDVSLNNEHSSNEILFLRFQAEI